MHWRLGLVGVLLALSMLVAFDSPPRVQAATFTLVGRVDGGRPSGATLSLSDTLVLISEDSGTPTRYAIDLRWVLNRLPDISQDDELLVEIEALPDGTLVATSVTNQTDRNGTKNQGASTGSRKVPEQERRERIKDDPVIVDGPTATPTPTVPTATPTLTTTPATATPSPTPTQTSGSTTILRVLDAAGQVGNPSSLQLNGSGHPVVSYYDESNRALKLAVCSDSTCSASPTIRTLDSGPTPGGVGRGSSLRLNASGHPVISYFDQPNFVLKLAVCSDPSCSTAPTIRVIDSSGLVGVSTSLQLNASGHPVIAYYDFGNGNLKLAVCSDATCSAAPSIRVLDSAGDVGREPSLQLNSSGHPVISYRESVNLAVVTNLKLAVCTDAACSATPTVRTVETGGAPGFSSSLALDSSQRPRIAHFDNATGRIKLTACSDPTCSAPPTSRVIGSGGTTVSLHLNGSGLPVMAYPSNGLTVAVCSDATCSAAPTINVVDPTGGLFSPSLQVTTSGHPVMSYFDNLRDDLRLAVCVNPTCAP
jgi:hypothetical protein